MKRRLKRTTKQYIIVTFICIFVIGGAATVTSVIITGQVRDEYTSLLSTAYQEMETNKREVYVATQDIPVGELITVDNVELRDVYATQPAEIYMTEEELGKIAIIEIAAGTQLIHTMVSTEAISSELRELEYQVIHISSNILGSDTVDVRIVYPNGEDYIILSKKELKAISHDERSCFLWLSEEEILRMASAIVDGYLYQGARIYTTKYIDPYLQEESIVTYEPSLSTLLLIQDNPNIIDTATTALSKQVRKALENRLADSYRTDVTDIEWTLSPNDFKEFQELPFVLIPEEKATYQDELREKEAELDYGP